MIVPSTLSDFGPGIRRVGADCVEKLLRSALTGAGPEFCSAGGRISLPNGGTILAAENKRSENLGRFEPERVFQHNRLKTDLRRRGRPLALARQACER